MNRSLFVAVSAVVLIGLSVSAFAQASPVEVHGYMLNRIYANPSSAARIANERISISAAAKLGDKGNAYVEWYIHPWIPDKTAPVVGTPALPPSPTAFTPIPSDATRTLTTDEYRWYLESAYWELPLGSGKLKIGKTRQLNFGMTPTYGNRKMTQYGIVSETFTQDRVVGLQYTLNKNKFDGGLTVYTDQLIDKRFIGGFPGSIDYGFTTDPKISDWDSIPHFVEKDIPGQISGRMAATAKLGVVTKSLTAHVSAMGGQFPLSNIQATINKAYAGLSTNTNTDHNKFGVDALYTRGNLCFSGEYYKGKFSVLDITGYSLLVGYQPKDNRRFYVRYGNLNNDRTPNGNPYTWDTRQLIFGLIQPIGKGIWAELEYEKNMASVPGGLTAGDSKPDNDLFFCEFFTGF